MREFVMGCIIQAVGFLLFPTVAEELNIISKTPMCCNNHAEFIGLTSSLIEKKYHYQCQKCQKIIMVNR